MYRKPGPGIAVNCFCRIAKSPSRARYFAESLLHAISFWIGTFETLGTGSRLIAGMQFGRVVARIHAHDAFDHGDTRSLESVVDGEDRSFDRDERVIGGDEQMRPVCCLAACTMTWPSSR